jgi:hypothetical protein
MAIEWFEVSWLFLLNGSIVANVFDTGLLLYLFRNEFRPAAATRTRESNSHHVASERRYFEAPDILERIRLRRILAIDLVLVTQDRLRTLFIKTENDWPEVTSVPLVESSDRLILTWAGLNRIPESLVVAGCHDFASHKRRLGPYHMPESDGLYPSQRTAEQRLEYEPVVTAQKRRDAP